MRGQRVRGGDGGRLGLITLLVGDKSEFEARAVGEVEAVDEQKRRKIMWLYG